MESFSSERKLTAREREYRALERRKQGWTYTKIAAELGCNPGHCCRMVRAALERFMGKLAERAVECREIEVQRLDDYLSKLQTRIEDGDIRAVTAAVKIMERRSKLLGLDAPARVQTTSNVDPITGMTNEQLNQWAESVGFDSDPSLMGFKHPTWTLSDPALNPTEGQ